MTPRLVSSRPDPVSPRPSRGGGRPPGKPPGRFARIFAFVLIAAGLAVLWLVYTWTPCAACAAL